MEHDTSTVRTPTMNVLPRFICAGSAAALYTHYSYCCVYIKGVGGDMTHLAKEGRGLKKCHRGRERFLRLPGDTLVVASLVVVGLLALQARIRVDIPVLGVLAFLGDTQVVGSRGSRAHHGRRSRRVAGFLPGKLSALSAREQQSVGQIGRVCGHLQSAGSRDIITGSVDGNLSTHQQEEAVYTLLIDNYDSYTYNLFQQLAIINGRAPFVVYNDDDGGDLRKAIERMGCMPDNIVISPGPGRPDIPVDFGMCTQALIEALDIPILGVCLGHEGLGLAHGAEVVRAHEPMHGRLSPIFHSGDSLFRGVPQGARVVRYHSLVVDPATLPSDGELEATAWTADGALMAMRHRTLPHWGVQFHPESVGTRHGADIVRNFRDLTLGWQRQAGKNKQNGLLSVALNTRMNTGLRTCNGARVELNGKARVDSRVSVDGILPSISPSLPVPALDRSATPTSRAETARTLVPPPSARPAKQEKFVLHVQELSSQGAIFDEHGARSTPITGGGASADVALESMPDTEEVFRALYGDASTAWWLDSSSQRPGLAVGGQAKARFSFMGDIGGPLSRFIECYGDNLLVVEDFEVEAKRGNDTGSAEGGVRRRRRRVVRANALDYLKAELARFGHPDECHASAHLSVKLVGKEGDVERQRGGPTNARDSLPFDFMGGYVGFLGYELRHEANDVLGRSVGGTEWQWQPPDGGTWAEVKFDEKSVDIVNINPPNGNLDIESAEAKSSGGSTDTIMRAGGGIDVPLGFLVFADRFLAFDHHENKVYLVALADETDTNGGIASVAAAREGNLDIDISGESAPSSASEGEALKWIRRTAEAVSRVSLLELDGDATRREHGRVTQSGSMGKYVAESSPAAASDDVAARARAATSTVCAMEVPRSRYERSLLDIMRLVEEGETYEVCLTNQIVCERPGGGQTSPLDLYARLRRSNPAPYAAYLVHDPNRRLLSDGAVEGEERSAGPSFAVCCSSPERFLMVDRHGWVESKPIKGTVKRGTTPMQDLELAAALAKGEKNMAENLMIVDLVRNDLGRVCRTGTVSVPKLMHVESYATVHQLVSTICGHLRAGCGALDAIAAAFPGGSMTGAPKRRTMDIIDRLEQGRSRGVYSGSIGFLSLDGAADLNIVIRTAVVTPRNVTVGAGGAVVALSEIDDEYQEMLLKATSVLSAIGHKQRRGELGPPGSESTAQLDVLRSKNAAIAGDAQAERENAPPQSERSGDEQQSSPQVSSVLDLGRVRHGIRKSGLGTPPAVVGNAASSPELRSDLEDDLPTRR